MPDTPIEQHRQKSVLYRAGRLTEFVKADDACLIALRTEHFVGIERARLRGVVHSRDLDVTHVDLRAVDVHRLVVGETLCKSMQDAGLACTRGTLDQDGGVRGKVSHGVGTLIDAEFHIYLQLNWFNYSQREFRKNFVHFVLQMVLKFGSGFKAVHIDTGQGSLQRLSCLLQLGVACHIQ